MSNIKDIIVNYVSNLLGKEKFYSQVGTVISVNESGKVCTVELLTGETIEDVRLETDLLVNSEGDIAQKAPSGFILVPVQGSEVVVSFCSNTDAFVSMFSQVGNVFMKSEQFQFNDGDNGGLINVVDLVGKINDIEGDLNDLKAVFTSWVVVSNDGGAALKTASATWAGSTITETERGDIEDTKITH